VGEILFYNQFQLSSQLLHVAVTFRSSLIVTGQVQLCQAAPKGVSFLQSIFPD